MSRDVVFVAEAEETDFRTMSQTPLSAPLVAYPNSRSAPLVLRKILLSTPHDILVVEESFSRTWHDAIEVSRRLFTQDVMVSYVLRVT